MSLNPLYLSPLRGKVATWGLPIEVELAFLRELKNKIEGFPVCKCTRVKTYEFMICDPATRDLYKFYGRVAMREHEGFAMLVDCDFEFIPEYQEQGKGCCEEGCCEE